MVVSEKALDFVSFDFMSVTLKIFGFGPVYKKMINILLAETEDGCFSRVTIVNGHISEQFPVLCGCRKGDSMDGSLSLCSLQ